MTTGLYDADGKIRTTVVDGSSLTGLYAADGSVNIVLDDSTYKGVYHPCGAYRVSSTTGITSYDPSGAYYLNFLLGSKGGTARTGLLRTVANNSNMQSGDASGANTAQVGRQFYTIGSGDVDSLVFAFDNWQLGASADVPYTTNLFIDPSYVRYNGVTVPITFDGGSTSKTLAGGAVNVHSDALTPSQFSATKFARGDVVELRIQLHRADTSENIPCTQTNQNSSYTDLGGSVGWFIPGNTTVTNLNGSGAYTVTGTSLAARAVGYRPILLGTFTLGDPETWIAFGDSITVGLNGNAGNSGHAGIGYFAQAMQDNTTVGGSVTNPRAFIDMGKGGSNIGGVTGSNTLSWNYIQYCKYMHTMFGANDFGSSGTSTTGTALITLLRTLWTAGRNRGIKKILQSEPLTRTSSTDSYATDANQTLAGAGWGSGGAVETYRGLLPAEVASGNINGVVSWTSYQSLNNKYFWFNNGTSTYATSDGLHPSTVITGTLASEFRTAKASFT